MKLAAVHCWIASWWALDVCKDLIQKEDNSHNFSDITIFTSYSQISNISINNKKITIITALPKRLNNFFSRNTKKKLPILGQLFDYRNLMIIYPLLMKIISKKIKKYHPHKILISSFAIAKNIEQCKTTNNSKIETTLYLHSPMQYIWSHYKEYKQKLTWWKGILFKNMVPKLQKRDLKYTKYTTVFTNSWYTQNLAKKIYKINSKIKYPTINQIFLNETVEEKPKEYCVYIGRLVKFVKEVDLIIKVFNKTNYPLIIIGSWPDEQELKKMANKNITFTWRKSQKDTIKLLKKAKGSINITKESFGLSTVESLCLGIPVLWYNQGASPELITKDCWLLINKKNEKELTLALQKFLAQQRKRKDIAKQTRKKFTSS